MVPVQPALGLDDIGKVIDKACDVSIGCHVGKSAASTAKDTAKSVTKVADFASDPLGYIATSMEKSCEDLARNLFGSLAAVLHPDFSVAWFKDAYQVSFALGIIVMGFLLMSEFVSYRKGQRGTDEILDNVLAYVPVYFLGVMLGPFIGNLLCQTIGALCDGLVTWGGGEGGMKGAGTSVSQIITAASPQSLMGGSVIAIGIFFFMLVAFVGVAIGLMMMFITLYMAGVLFPLGWAWIVRTRDRQIAFKVLNVVLGIFMSQPIVFFMLGFVMAMVKANIFGRGDNGSATTHFFALIGSVLALLMVAFTPWTMTKFAPIGANVNAGPTVGDLTGRARSMGRSSSSSDGQLGQVSRMQSTSSDAGSSSMSGAGGGASSMGGSSGGGSGGAAGAAGGAAAVGKAAYDGAKATGKAANEGTDAAMSQGAQTSGEDSDSESAAAGKASDTGAHSASGTGGGPGALGGAVDAQQHDETASGSSSSGSSADGDGGASALADAASSATPIGGSEGSDDQAAALAAAAATGGTSMAAEGGMAADGGSAMSSSGGGGGPRSALSVAGKAAHGAKSLGEVVDRHTSAHMNVETK